MPRFYFLLTLLALASCDDATLRQQSSKESWKAAIPVYQLLKDALGWMTFRKDGRLMTDSELTPLFLEPHLIPKYRKSKYYQSFVIAFQQGVLPRLTLQENDPCDPTCTLKYKDPDNGSVIWYYQKMFTYDSYKTRSSSSVNFCDYRQGLVCKSASKKCQCPDGAVMQPIESGSSVKRCLLQENEICALIDIDHGNDPRHSALGRALHHLIFNLEKPPSKAGTQCRFKYDPNNDIPFSHCYPVNGGPWHPRHHDNGIIEYWRVPLGSECVLGLMAHPGSCEHGRESLGTFWGYVCYNFGPPRSQKASPTAPEPRTGFCAHEIGMYGLASGNSHTNFWRRYHPLWSPYMSPRTIPLRGEELANFYKKYYTEFYDWFFPPRLRPVLMEEEEGGRCSVSKTETLQKIWTYFASLAEDPPPGQDFVAAATKAELDSHLQLAVDLIADLKVCQVFQKKVGEPSFTCVADGSPDSAGNDGTCQKPGKLDTAAFTAKFDAFRDKLAAIELHNYKEYENYDSNIFRENPGPTCTPGECPEEYVCYEDFRQDYVKYNYYCELTSPPHRVCHDIVTVDRLRLYGNCENRYLNERAFQEFEKIVEHSSLGRGEACRYELEGRIREWLRSRSLPHEVDKYKILGQLEEERTLGGGAGFCDRTRLLECAMGGVCKCVESTEPRKVTIDGKEYQSDYCYLAQGSCWKNVTELMPLTNAEKKRILSHYGYGVEGEDCAKNVCVFLGGNGEECTTENTGKTGHDLEPDVTEKPTTSTTERHTAGGPGWRDAGGAGDLRGSTKVTGFGLASCLIIIMISFVEI